MIDKFLIEKKLRKIEKYINEIYNEQTISDFNVFNKNIVFKRFVERNIELCIELMIDICKHLVSKLNLNEPETYADCIDIIKEKNIIPKSYSENFKKMIRYRNLIIHGYEGVDDSITYGIYKNHLKDFNDFISVIRKYLKS